MRCTPGDLAIVISSEFEENIGQTVDVVEYDSECSAWLVKGLRPGRCRDLETNEINYTCDSEGYICDHRLMPIGGFTVDKKECEVVT